jgi:hypothetical protein
LSHRCMIEETEGSIAHRPRPVLLVNLHSFSRLFRFPRVMLTAAVLASTSRRDHPCHTRGGMRAGSPTRQQLKASPLASSVLFPSESLAMASWMFISLLSPDECSRRMSVQIDPPTRPTEVTRLARGCGRGRFLSAVTAERSHDDHPWPVTTMRLLQTRRSMSHRD